MFPVSKNKEADSTAAVDSIEAIIYKAVKPLGFRKFGRTLHRFVDGDISQVIHFQNGCPQKGVYDVLWVNLGIRVPECAERTFTVSAEKKQYYHEYDCNIRTRLGEQTRGKAIVYDLREAPERIGEDILKNVTESVLPLYEKINCRQAVLAHRELLCDFDHMNYRRMADLQEAMIYGARGEVEGARALFGRYYKESVEHGHVGHVRYLRDLAEKLGISLE